MALAYRYLVRAGEFQGKACKPLRASRTKPGWIVVQLKDEGTVELPLTWIQSKVSRRKANSKKIEASGP